MNVNYAIKDGQYVGFRFLCPVVYQLQVSQMLLTRSAGVNRQSDIEDQYLS